MRYGSEHKEATRRRLVQETAEVIRHEGLHAVGVAAVMKRLGLTHGGFYAHFDSREALVTAGVDQMYQDGVALFTSRVRKLPPGEALTRYIVFYLSSAHRDFAGGSCPLPVLAADAPRLPGAARDQYAAGAQGVREVLAGLIGALGRPEPEALASSVLAELVGAVALARAEPDPARSDAILSHSRAQLAARLGLEGQS
ncbi:TetR/AcrR family transcriptional regulator [Phenylobacterium deserti]|uniref:TetR/AcrR family transcriptional regulator n=1 Tax=Phenylobacterium deserti TaxID=1914756 RepID=A0A328ASN3_9CAUL|nr:TetR/AcrR family transcriptional regulator [Phenylobacterium deserti]RAK58083.1 TetR/AcrR family transcriptional regulator [Phenylobacterium deserti]